MYHTEKNPLKRIGRESEHVVIPRGTRQRRLHKAFLRYHDPDNWPLLRKVLTAMGRDDLMGPGTDKLLPGFGHQGAGYGHGKRYQTFKTQHTGLPHNPRGPEDRTVSLGNRQGKRTGKKKSPPSGRSRSRQG